jgi:hypothetical protein
VFVTRGVTVSDNIVTDECPDTTTAGVFYQETAGIFATGGSVLTIAHRSSAFDAFLMLVQVSGGSPVTVAANDDSASGNTNAFIQYTVPQSALFVIIVSTSAEKATGAYTLSVGTSTTAAPMASGTIEPLRQAPSRLSTDWARTGARPLPRAARSH